MTTHPHDRFFRFVSSRREHAVALARLVLPPQIAAIVDFEGLRVVSGSVVSERLRERIADLVFEVPLLGGGECVIDLVVEHQSTNDRWMAPRGFHLVGERWAAWLGDNPDGQALPMVLTVVISHEPGGWRAPTDVRDLLALDDEQRRRFEGFLPSAPYHVFDLAAVDDETLAAAAQTASVELMLLCFRHARDLESLRRILPIRAELIRLTSKRHDGRATISGLLHYFAGLAATPEMEWDLYEAVFEACTPEVREELEMESIEQFVEKHGQKWREAFAARTRAEAVENDRAKIRRTLVEIVYQRFGISTLPTGLRSRIDAADFDGLLAAVARVHTAARIEDVIPAA